MWRPRLPPRVLWALPLGMVVALWARGHSRADTLLVSTRLCEYRLASGGGLLAVERWTYDTQGFTDRSGWHPYGRWESQYFPLRHWDTYGFLIYHGGHDDIRVGKGGSIIGSVVFVDGVTVPLWAVALIAAFPPAWVVGRTLRRREGGRGFPVD